MLRVIKQNKNEDGFLLLEALVGILLLGIMGAAVAEATNFGLRMRDKAVNDAIAAQIAQETIEDFAAIDPNTLDDGEVYEDSVERDGTTFAAETTVTVNDDSSRTLSVSVNTGAQVLGGKINMTHTLMSWDL